MTTLNLEDEKVVALFKTALSQLLEERTDLFKDIFEEAIEDLALSKAIEEGHGSGIVPEEEIMAIIRG